MRNWEWGGLHRDTEGTELESRKGGSVEVGHGPVCIPTADRGNENNGLIVIIVMAHTFPAAVIAAYDFQLE